MQVSIPTSDLGDVSTPAPLNVRAFCTCDAFPGDFHEIVPGVCPDTYTESTDGRRVTLVAGDRPGTLRVGDPRQASGPGPDGSVTLVPIVMQQENAIDNDDAMGAARRACERRNLASGTITTWQKRWQQFAKVFRELPQDRETVLAYLDRFTTPKYRNSQRDALRALYRYAAEGGSPPPIPSRGPAGRGSRNSPSTHSRWRRWPRPTRCPCRIVSGRSGSCWSVTDGARSRCSASSRRTCGMPPMGSSGCGARSAPR